MPLTMEELQGLVKAQGLSYFVDPDGSSLLLPVAGLSGNFQFMILLDLDGTFVQFRSIQYLSCPREVTEKGRTVPNPHLAAVLEVLGEINYRVRMVKYGWDPTDGEIVAYADVWIQDGTRSPGSSSTA